MNDSSGLPFERELRITRAKDSGLVAYIDGANEPSIAWSDERDFVSWQQRHLPASRSSVADHETSVDEIEAALKVIKSDGFRRLLNMGRLQLVLVEAPVMHDPGMAPPPDNGTIFGPIG